MAAGISYNWQYLALGNSKAISDQYKDAIVSKFNSALIKTEKLAGSSKLFAFRLNDTERVICTIKKYQEAEDCLVVLEILPKHEYDRSLYVNGTASVNDININDLKIITLDSPRIGFQSADGVSVLDKAQAEVVTGFKPNPASSEIFIVKGMAGSGKTTIAQILLEKSKDFGSKVLYTTKSERLLNFIKKQHVKNTDAAAQDNRAAEDKCASGGGHLEFLAYQDLWHEAIFNKEIFTNWLNTRPDNATGKQKKSKAKKASLTKEEINDSYNNMLKAYRGEIVDGNGKKSEELLQAYLSAKLCDVKTFTSWANQRSKELIASKDPAYLHKLYEDIVKVDGGQDLSKKNSFSSSDTNTAKKVLAEYKKFLRDTQRFDLSLLENEVHAANAATAEEQQSAEEKKYDVIFVDESQDLSKQQLAHIFSLLAENGQIYYLMDGNQNLVDTFNQTPQYVHQIARKAHKSVQEYSLNVAYRTPKNVTELANKIIEIKAHAVGGKLNKHDQQESKEADAEAASSEAQMHKNTEDDCLRSNVEQAGAVVWMDFQDKDLDQNSLRELKKEAADSIECVIIIADEACRKNAESTFPRGMVFTAEQIKGEEFAKVILFNFFSGEYQDNNFAAAVERYDASKSIPCNYPKDLTNAHYAKQFNKLFVAVTRATNSVVFVETQTSKSNNNAKTLYSKIFSRQLQGESVKLKVSSLDEVMAKINSSCALWETNFLSQYIEKATDLIHKNLTQPSSDDGQTQKYLKYVKSLKEILSARNSASEVDIQNMKNIDGLLTRLIPEVPQEVKVSAQATGQKSLAKLSALDPSSDSNKKSGQNQSAKQGFSTSKESKSGYKNNAKQPNNTADIAKLFFDTKVDPNSGDQNGTTPLIFAAHCGYKDGAESLIKKGANVNVQDNNGATALILAAHNGHTEIVELLITKGADLDLQNKDGTTALAVAAQHGYTEIVELLIEKGANVNVQDNNGATALILAAQNGHTKIAELLIKEGANINAKDNNDAMALLFAAHNGHTEIVELLIEKVADVNVKDKKGRTALLFAAHNGHTKIAELLINAKADLNSQNEDGFTALSIATQRGYIETVKLLITKGADLNSGDKNGNAPLIFAAHYGHKDTVESLIKKGANVNVKNKNGITALYVAAQNKHTDVVKLLINAKADLNLQNKDGSTALSIATQYRYTEIVELLQKATAARLCAEEESANNETTTVSNATDNGDDPTCPSTDNLGVKKVDVEVSGANYEDESC